MRMQTRVSAAILTAVLLGAGALPAAAQKSADTTATTNGFRSRGSTLRLDGIQCHRQTMGASRRGKKSPSGAE